MREDGSRVPAVKFFSLLQEAKEGKKKKRLAWLMKLPIKFWGASGRGVCLKENCRKAGCQWGGKVRTRGQL